MPVRADDNDIDLDEPKPKATRPVIKATATSGVVAEVGLPQTILKSEMPIIRARVVYLGPSESHSVAFGGQVHETYLEDEEGTVERRDRDGHEADGTVIPGKMRRYTVLKQAVDNAGTTQYDFSTRDSLGRIITERLMPDSASEKLRGRPFAWCEHVGHLRRFYMARDERNENLYFIMVRPEQIPIVQEHIRRSERARRQQESLFSEVSGR